MDKMGSGGRFGSAGTVDIRRAAEVGKYMSGAERHKCNGN